MHREIVLIAALAATPSLDAQRGGGRGAGGDVLGFLVAKYDKDKDGKVTAAEYDRGAAKFQAYDKDGDGVLSRADFAGGGRRRSARGAAGEGRVRRPWRPRLPAPDLRRAKGPSSSRPSSPPPGGFAPGRAKSTHSVAEDREAMESHQDVDVEEGDHGPSLLVAQRRISFPPPRSPAPGR